MSAAPDARAEPGTAAWSEPRRGALIALVLLAAFFGARWARDVSVERTWGWDESMHAELPAARMALHAQRGEIRAALDVALDCQQYPFVYPVVLAAVQGATGISERACRATTRALWALAVLGLSLAFLRAARIERIDRPIGVIVAPFCALGSALAMSYSGTLFLEVPFACVLAFALHAWLLRKPVDGERPRARRDLIAGAWLALLFFTKFNYALLAIGGFALDLSIETVGASRREGGRAAIARALRVGAIPLLAALWWFVAPLPGDLALAARHREAFAAFLAGNQDLPRIAWNARALDAWFLFSASPLLLALTAIGAALSLLSLHKPATRAAWIVTLALGVPIALHPFHLDRFWVPLLVPLLVVAALGYRGRLGNGAFAVAVAVGLAGQVLAPSSPRSVLERLGLWRDDLAAYLEQQYGERVSRQPHKALPTGGLARGESNALLDLAAGEVGPSERVGWIGISSELSPCALHVGLLDRGGSVERFLRDAHEPIDVTFEGVDPQWTAAQLAEFARGFDVILATDPPDLGDRAGRRFIARYRAMLVGELGWSERELGATPIQKGARPPYPVRLFACRPPTK